MRKIYGGAQPKRLGSARDFDRLPFRARIPVTGDCDRDCANAARDQVENQRRVTARARSGAQGAGGEHTSLAPRTVEGDERGREGSRSTYIEYITDMIIKSKRGAEVGRQTIDLNIVQRDGE